MPCLQRRVASNIRHYNACKWLLRPMHSMTCIQRLRLGQFRSFFVKNVESNDSLHAVAYHAIVKPRPSCKRMAHTAAPILATKPDTGQVVATHPRQTHLWNRIAELKSKRICSVQSSFLIGNILESSLAFVWWVGRPDNGSRRHRKAEGNEIDSLPLCLTYSHAASRNTLGWGLHFNIRIFS